MENTNNCLNCNQHMHGPICAHCGQKSALPFETKRIIIDVWSHLLELDYKFIRTIQGMFTAPGTLINDYISGRRILYTNPFKFLFFVATAYFLIIQIFDIKIGFSKKFEGSEEYGREIVALLNYLVFLFLIPTAYFFKKIYQKSKINFAESYIASCYLWSGYLLVAIPLSSLLSWLHLYHIYLRVLIGLVFLVIATKQMFTLTWYTSIFKTILLFLGYILSAASIMGLLIALSYWIGFEPLMIPLKPGS